MDWSWTASFDHLWRSPTFPMWLTLAAAAFFALILLVTLLRADRSVANGALTVITLLAVAVAAAATIRGFGPGATAPAGHAGAPLRTNASLPALSCLDDLAGDTVEVACEKALFGSPDAVAAAVSYVAAQIGALTSLGDVSAANKVMTPELQAMRHAVENDRYGLVAHVLATRDRCTPANCAAYRSLTDHSHIAANMEGNAYDGLVTRYAASWSGATAGLAAASAAAAVDAPRSVPTGKPTNADFPSSSSIPPVSIMTPEPGAKATAANASPPAPEPTPTPEPRPATAAAAAKTSPAPHHAAPARRRPAAAPKPAAPSAPVQLTPAAQAPDSR
jgi:hypothetical protein